MLTLGAELNAGQSKVARIAQYFEDYEQLLSQNGSSATLQKPVIILPGLNHSDFSQGFKVKGDLDSEVDAETAIDRISEASAAFINVNDKYNADELGNSQDILAEMIEKTRIMTAPVLEAKELEDTGHWCVEAQKLVAGEFAEHLDFNTINVNSNYSFMRAHANVKQGDSGRLNVTVVSYPRKQKDTLKLGKTISAEDIACKMTSKEKLALLFGVSLKEKIVSCTDINKYAFSLAENKLPESVLDRYHRLGKKVIFEEDFKPYIGPQFVFATKLNFLDTENFLHLSSPILYTSLTSKTYPGKHYCKLISPARAMEWIMTDSLTK